MNEKVLEKVSVLSKAFGTSRLDEVAEKMRRAVRRGKVTRFEAKVVQIMQKVPQRVAREKNYKKLMGPAGSNNAEFFMLGDIPFHSQAQQVLWRDVVDAVGQEWLDSNAKHFELWTKGEYLLKGEEAA